MHWLLAATKKHPLQLQFQRLWLLLLQKHLLPQPLPPLQLLVPLAMEAAFRCAVSPVPFIVSVTIGVSAGFLNPYGYHVLLLAMSAGGYRVLDYVKIGLLVDVVVCGVCVARCLGQGELLLRLH
mgnify:CR=1 FL=1